MKLTTTLRSRVMRMLASVSLLNTRRGSARPRRKLRRTPPTVHYFHQVDDPYGHLAVQKLAAFADQYQIAIVPHLVSAPEADYQGAMFYFDGEWFWGVDRLHLLERRLQQTGVTVKLRPVMPMLMRGIPAPQAKQSYIIQDAAMLQAVLWGVPSFRVRGPGGRPDTEDSFACWGQDRIWRIGEEIARRRDS